MVNGARRHLEPSSKGQDGSNQRLLCADIRIWTPISTTIERQVGFCTVNLQGRVNGPENSQPRWANDPRYDILYRSARGEYTAYDPLQHGIWRIARKQNGSLQVECVNANRMPECQHKDALYAVALAHKNRKRFDKAEFALERALSLDPHYEPAKQEIELLTTKKRKSRGSASGRTEPQNEEGTTYKRGEGSVHMSPEESRLVNGFCRWLRSMGITKPRTGVRYVDVVFRHNRIDYAVEAKCADGKPWNAIRDALGQVLYYQLYPHREKHGLWLVLIDEKPHRRRQVMAADHAQHVRRRSISSLLDMEVQLRFRV